MLFRSREAILLHALTADDHAGLFLDANDLACEALGFTREELLIRTPEDLLAPDQVWELPVIIENIVLQCHATVELSLRRKDGKCTQVAVTAHLFRLHDQRTICWTLHDVKESRRQEQLEEIFASLAHQLSTVSTPQEAAMAIIETADELFGWDAAYLNLYSPNNGDTYSVVSIDTVDGKKVPFPPPPYNRPMGPLSERVMREGAYLYNSDELSDEDERVLIPFGDVRKRSETAMCVPVRKGGFNFGVLSIQSYRPNAYTGGDLQVLQILADHCAGALDRTVAEVWLRKHAFLSRKFAELGKSLAAVTTPEEAAQVILTTAEDLFGWHAAFVVFYHERDDITQSVLSYDTFDRITRRVNPEVDSKPSPIFRKVLVEGAQLILRENGQPDPDDGEFVAFGDKSRPSNSMMYAPMRSGDSVIGILSVQSYQYNAYNTEALEQLQALADHCAGALSRALTLHQLRLSEARLRLVTEQLPALLWTVDVDFRLTLFLGDVVRDLELKNGNVQGKLLTELLPNRNTAATVTQMHEKALKGESGIYEILWNNLYLHCYVEPLRDDGGQVIGCINVAHNISQLKQTQIALRQAQEELEERVDKRTQELSRSNSQLKLEITERRKTEAELAQSVSLLRATLEAATDGIVAVDHQGRIIQHNQKWGRIWSVSSLDLKNAEGISFEDYILPRLKKPGEFRNLLKTSYLARESEFYEIVELADGRVLEAYSKVQRVIGKSVGRVWSFRDVTLRRLAEKALVQSETNYREAIENASGVPYRLQFDSDGYEFMGKGVEGLLGIPPTTIHKREIERFTIKTSILDERNWRLSEYQQAFRRGELDCYRVDLHVRLPDGTEKWINDCSVPIREEKTGRVVGSLGILQDITQRKRQEELHRQRQERLNQAEKLIALGTLVSGVAHEINNPNNFIMLNAPILQEAWQDISPILENYFEDNGDFIMGGLNYSEMRLHIPDLFDGLLKGGMRIKNIVQELRDFARPQPDAWKEQIDLNAVVNSALVLLQNIVKTSVANFEVELHECLPPIMGNFQRLEQVVINLIQNACESLSGAQQRVCVRTCAVDNEVVLTVQDSGCGIAEGDLKHILDPFYTTKRDSGGTGLGLSITSNIVRDHGGIIDFASRAGEGTLATLRFPAVGSEAVILLEKANGHD